jgi:hypothetical protein
MGIAYDKTMRERAKQEGKYLFQVSLNCKYLSDETREKFKGKAPTTVDFAIAGPLGPEEATQLWRLVKKWLKAKKV